MARDDEAKRIGTDLTNAWAASGDRSLPASESPAIARSVGWTDTYEGVSGEPLSRELVNQMFREIYGIAIEINAHGLLEWDADLAYQHPTMVFGSDSTVYLSVQNSTNVDPVSDSDNSHWQSISDVIGVSNFEISALTTVTPARADVLAFSDVSRSDDANRAATITSVFGLLQDTDIPNLNASKINDGEFTLARIPNITIGNGGTGATTAENARSNLGLGDLAVVEATISEDDVGATLSSGSWHIQIE